MSQRKGFANQRQQLESGCGFCKRNREPVAVYMSHQLKNHLGQVVCPQLSKYRCELCGSTGTEAHTRSYCPQVISFRQQQKVIERSRRQAVDCTRSQPLGQSQAANLNSASSSSASSSQKSAAAASRDGNHHGHQQTGSEDEEDDDYSIAIDLGQNRMLSNMGSVSNSRYNSAGRLRHPHRFHRQQSQHQRQPYHQQQGQQPDPDNTTTTKQASSAGYFGNYRQ